MSFSYKNENNSKISEIEMFMIALVLGLWFLTFESFIRARDLYRYLPIVDIPSHFFSGLALGLGFYWLMLVLLKRKSLAFLVTFSVILTFGAAITWEITEYIEDYVVPQSIHYMDYFVWDGFFDIIFTTGGSALILVFFYYNKKSVYKTNPHLLKKQTLKHCISKIKHC